MAAGGPADGLQELTGHVDLDGASCVNERPGFELRGALQGTGLLKSDDNDELLLQLPFKGSVHARFIEIEAPAGEVWPTVLAVGGAGALCFVGPRVRAFFTRALVWRPLPLARRPPPQGDQGLPQPVVDAH